MAHLAFTTYDETRELELSSTRGKVIGNNTRAYRDPADGKVIVTLHHHHIVTLYPSGAVYISDAGYWAVTTKERLNQFLRPLGAKVFSKRGTPTLVTRDGEELWTGQAIVEKVFVPQMGFQSCRYVYDGNDPEDGDYYRCLIHDAVTLGHEVSCEKAGDGPEEVLLYQFRWGQHTGTVAAASTEEATRVIQASGISSTEELFLTVPEVQSA